MSQIDLMLAELAEAVQKSSSSDRRLANAAVAVADAMVDAARALKPFADFYAQQLERQGPAFADSKSSLLLSRPTPNLLNVQHLRAAHEAVTRKP